MPCALLLLGLLARQPATAVPLDGLTLWLDATDVTGTGSNPPGGSALDSWIDRSGTGHHAIQATVPSRPTLVANAIGTNPAVRFDGDDWMSAGTLRTVPGNLQVFVVSKRSSAQLGGGANNTYQRLISTSDGADAIDWQPPDWTLVSAYDGNGNALTYGPDIRTTSTSNGTLKIANLTLGRDAANTFSLFKGDLAEVLIYSNALAAADVALVTNYLHTKWLTQTNTPGAARPSIGAIRWDAWIGDAYGVGRAVNKSLGPLQWHDRLPYFGVALSDTQVVVQATTQSDADRQIAYARAAGVDYWAFVMYATNDPMTRFGIDLYQASPQREAVQFCMISQAATPASWPALQSRYLNYFAMTNHVRVAGNRPLFYQFDPSSLVQAGAFASWAAAKAAFNQLRAAATNAGLGNPYLVVLEFDASAGKTAMDQLGFDAISSYAVSGGHTAGSYATLAATAAARWEAQRATGAKVIPNVTTGWDRRPRVQNPVPWEPWQVPGDGLHLYYAAPTPSQWATHLQAALNWVDTYPASTDARTVLIYAWNEIDEGGWLLPTHAERTARLETMRAVTGAAIDGDGDTMDDLWETWHLGHPTNSHGGSADLDRDGSPDRDEFLAGTDPTNAASRLAWSLPGVASATDLTLSWQSATGRTYRLLSTPNLQAPWLTNHPALPATPPMNTVTVSTLGTAHFWKLELTP